MKLSSRVENVKESITLTVNEQVNKLAKGGQHIYNLTAGQLPFKPSSEFIHVISTQLNFLKSYQYSPVRGFPELTSKIKTHIEKKRGVSFDDVEGDFSVIVSNGSKQSLYNIFGSILNPSDEVILLTPYWVSYPEMIKFWGGEPKVVGSNAFDRFMPHIDEIKKAVTKKTKAIIVNSPNNPAGIHYDDAWMKDFAVFLKDHPDLIVVSDEVYSEISYYDPKPTFFYQFDRSLLAQTVIVDGISKSFASTGLRVGFCIAQKPLIDAMAKIQSQTTSGANSLIQKSLIEFDFDHLEHFLDPVKAQLRECAEIVRESFRVVNLSHCWYQTTSAFYYFIDFSRMPVSENYSKDKDYSIEIVKDILDQTGVALVPGAAFGFPNSARMSMTLEVAPFSEAMEKLTAFLAAKKQ
jgi:aspartate aminotransferase